MLDRLRTTAIQRADRWMVQMICVSYKCLSLYWIRRISGSSSLNQNPKSRLKHQKGFVSHQMMTQMLFWLLWEANCHMQFLHRERPLELECRTQSIVQRQCDERNELVWVIKARFQYFLLNFWVWFFLVIASRPDLCPQSFPEPRLPTFDFIPRTSKSYASISRSPESSELQKVNRRQNHKEASP